MLVNSFANCNAGALVENRGGVKDERVQLLGGGLNDSLVAMPQRIDEDAGDAVDVPLAAVIADADALPCPK